MSPMISHDKEGMTLACPECDEGGDIYRREGNGNAIKEPDKPFYCCKCKTALDFLVEREERTPDELHAGGKSALGLEDLTPADIPGLTPMGERPGGDA